MCVMLLELYLSLVLICTFPAVFLELKLELVYLVIVDGFHFLLVIKVLPS